MDNLKSFLSTFIQKYPDARIHVREQPYEDGIFRLYFQVKDPDIEEDWEKSEDLFEEKLESILGAKLQVAVGNEEECKDYQSALRGDWTTVK
jgi:hypothetical protein